MTVSQPLVAIIGDSYDMIARHGGDVEGTRALIRQYTEVECAVLATRIEDVTGWPIITLREGRVTAHWLNQRQDGYLVDAHGAFPPFLRWAICRRHDVQEPEWRPWDGDFRPLCEDALADVDAFLATPWMLAVIPPGQRRAPPPAPPDPDENEFDDGDDDQGAEK